MKLRYRLMLGTFAAAGVCATFGVMEYRLAARASSEPEAISLRDLIARGETGNPHIILKDFTIFDDYIRQSKLVSGRWTKVWVPIIPADEDPADGGRPAIRAFLFSTNIGNEAEVLERFDRPTLRGMVNPDAPKPGIIGSVLIKRSYPGTDPKTCLIIEEGKQPAGALQLALYVIGTILATIATGGIWWLARTIDRWELEAQHEALVAEAVDGSEPIMDAQVIDDAPPPSRPRYRH